VFYVYKYLREDNSPYYIGKGKDDRAWTRSKHERIRLPKDKSRIVIVEENLSEEQAFQLEIELIKHYGRKDLGTGVLQNLTNGGEGPSGAVFGRPPDERIQKIKDALTGRKLSDETKEKMSLSAQKIKSDKWKESASKNRKGKLLSDAHRKFLSESRMGESNPMFGRESPNKGKKLSEETKKKIREARSKQVISEVTRKKMAESQILRHAMKRLNKE
jgi:hypothetical protein